jgi:hypothetical protein
VNFAPPTGGPGNYGYGTSGNPNPTGPANPNMPTMDPGGSTGTPLLTANTNSTFGKGIGQDVTQFLASNGGYNSALTQQAVQAQTQQMQLQANQNYGNLETNMGASGISPNSSASALESSNFWSQTTAAENAMTSQEFFNMWQSSMQNETGVLETAMGSAAQEKANQPSGFDWATLGTEIGGVGALAAFGL